MSKELFFEMQQRELYALSQKEIGQLAAEHAQQMIEAEQEDEFLKKVKQVGEYVTTVEKALKDSLINKVNGDYYSQLIDVKLSGRTTLNYKEDSVWCEINAQLKAREDLLKARAKTGKTIFDENGEEVPFVSSTTTDFLTIKVK
jgi:endo-alpha-1,4-polygalactosaminidase (GH114 family)